MCNYNIYYQVTKKCIKFPYIIIIFYIKLIIITVLLDSMIIHLYNIMLSHIPYNIRSCYCMYGLLLTLIEHEYGNADLYFSCITSSLSLLMRHVLPQSRSRHIFKINSCVKIYIIDCIRTCFSFFSDFVKNKTRLVR